MDMGGTDTNRFEEEKFENLAIKVGPYYDGESFDMLKYQRSRKPSKELLETVKLRPTYVSFPTLRNGRSPVGPYFNTPKVGYSSIDNSPPIFITSPDSVASYFESIGKMGVFSTTMSSINYFIGVGILGLPFTLRIAGWFGIITMMIVGAVMAYSGVILGYCQYKLSLRTYPDIAEAAFGFIGRDIVSIIFYLHLLFDMTLFQVLLQNSIDILMNTANVTVTSRGTFLLTTCILIILTNILTTMYTISFFSILGTISTLLVCILAIISCCLQSPSLNFEMLHKIKLFNSDSLRENILNQVKVFGIYSFCFMGHAVLPSLFKSMRNPSKYSIVVSTTFISTVIAYIAISVVGFLAFGDETSGNILENFESTATMTILIVIFTAAAVVTKFVLAGYPISEGLIALTSRYIFYAASANAERSNNITISHRVEYNLGNIEDEASLSNFTPRNEVWIGVIIRTLVPIISALLANMLPQFIELLSIIGAVFGSLISIIIPLLSHLKINSDSISLVKRTAIWFIICSEICVSLISIKYSKFGSN